MTSNSSKISSSSIFRVSEKVLSLFEFSVAAWLGMEPEYFFKCLSNTRGSKIWSSSHEDSTNYIQFTRGSDQKSYSSPTALTSEICSWFKILSYSLIYHLPIRRLNDGLIKVSGSWETVFHGFVSPVIVHGFKRAF